ncbi:unnamed protein product [Victoria cruziana]
MVCPKVAAKLKEMMEERCTAWGSTAGICLGSEIHSSRASKHHRKIYVHIGSWTHSKSAKVCAKQGKIEATCWSLCTNDHLKVSLVEKK